MNENAKRRRATLLIGLSLLSVGVINGADDRHFTRVALSSAPAEAAGQLTLTERVAYQYAIEEVYWRHRIWPRKGGESDRPKPSLDEVMSAAQIQQKVENYLRDSQLLADYWQRPITAEQLQAEMERMANQTKQPEVLHELFAALNNDPVLIAECLARPALSERFARDLYARDQRFHGEVRRRAESELQAHPRAKEMKRTSGVYTETEWIRTDSVETPRTNTASFGSLHESAVGQNPRRHDGGDRLLREMGSSEWQENIEILAFQLGNERPIQQRHPLKRPASKSGSRNNTKSPKNQNILAAIKTGALGPLQEDDTRYYTTAVLEKGKKRLRVATLAWLKEPFESWAIAAGSKTWETAVRPPAEFALPQVAGSSTGCTEDTWAGTDSGVPSVRSYHTAVWTGSEMIVWGGIGQFGNYLNSGGRYCAPTIPTPTPCPVCTPTPTPSSTPMLTPTATPTASPSPSPGGSPTVLGDISTRIQVGTGNNVLIAGFIVSGIQPKKVIARAIGPSLPFSGTLANPFLDLRDSSGTSIRTNDDWRTGGQEQEIIDTLIPPTNDLESAVVETLPANGAAYTAIVSGMNNGTGVGLVELYDIDHTVDSKFANISTRGFVQTGNDVMIAGTIVLGSMPQRVLIRALGPSLPFSGTLADPFLELRDPNGMVIRSCDNWHTCGQEAEIIATGAPPMNDAEAAIVANLSAGAYTAIVSGVNNTTGVALVEIYALTN